jgi:hypothetical protein
VRQPEDEDGGGEVLKPRAARGERIADEVRREAAREDEAKSGPRPDMPAGGRDIPRRLGYARPALCSAA